MYYYRPQRTFANGCTLQKMDYSPSEAFKRHYIIRFPSGPGRTALTYRKALEIIHNYKPMELK